MYDTHGKLFFFSVFTSFVEFFLNLGMLSAWFAATKAEDICFMFSRHLRLSFNLSTQINSNLVTCNYLNADDSVVNVRKRSKG